MDEYRKTIDMIDSELLRLFQERMETAGRIAKYKKEHGFPVLDAARESEKLAAVEKEAGAELASYAYRLYTVIFQLSRDYQESV